MSGQRAGRAEKRGALLLVASLAAGLVVTLPRASSAQYYCVDPTNGPGSCDYGDPDCPTFDSAGLRADYSSNREAAVYLSQLDWALDDLDYFALVNVGRSPILNNALDAPATGIHPSPPGWYDLPFEEPWDECCTMKAARVTEDASDPDVTRPAILMACGVHPHEWIPQEVCLRYLDYLVRTANLEPETPEEEAEVAQVQEMLSQTEIWIVAVANPAGRMYDESFTGWGDPADPPVDGYKDHRKNYQWVSGFTCDEDWSEDKHSGACSTPFVDSARGFEERDEFISRWNDVGINVGHGFSYNWGSRASMLFGRDEIVDDVSFEEAIPQRTTCGNDADCTFSFHNECEEYFEGAATVSGCFVAPGFPTLPDCLADVAANPVTDDFEIDNNICLLTHTPSGDQWFRWECGGPGVIPYVDRDTVSNPWLSHPEELLQWCEGGVLVSCTTDADCHVALNIYDVPSMSTAGDDVLPPHLMDVQAEVDEHLYCAANFCAVDAGKSCCFRDYRGRRPFESVETRLLRELINNVPFSVVLDVHSSRATFDSPCVNVGGGCGGLARAQRVSLVNELIVVYNDAAEEDWDLVHTAHDFPDFLRFENRGVGAWGDGRLRGWATSMATADEYGPGDWIPASGANFDNQTLRAILSFGWELGSRRTWPADENDFRDQCIGCGDDPTAAPGPHPGRPRSTLMVENQLAGTKAAIEYLATQVALVPNVARDRLGGALIMNRRDVGLTGLRIHDGHGRGVQQTEMRWNRIDDDFMAQIVVPAGNWAVSVCASAGNTTTVITPLDTALEIRQMKLVVPPFGIPYYTEQDSLSVFTGIEPGARECFTRRFEFDAGETYLVRASLDSALTESDTLSDDLQIAKVNVLDCAADEAPNGLNPDEFCGAGLPFDDTDFVCWDSEGRCRECWFGLLPQLCDEGEFCVDGMCDDAFTCWSGQIEDEYEGEPDTTPWFVGDFGSVFGRTLHKVDSLGQPIQDVDSADFWGIGQEPDGSFLELNVDVINHCATGAYLYGIKEEMEIKVVQAYFSGEYAADQEILLDWTHPVVGGVDIVLNGEQVEAYLSDKPIRVYVRNSETDPWSFSYTMNAKLQFYAPEVDWDPWDPPPNDPVIPTGPWDEFELNFEKGKIPEIQPIPPAVEQGYIVFFRPEDPFGSLTRTTSMVMLDASGNVATTPDGQVVGHAEELDDGLAIRMAGLVREYGPYTVYLQNDTERVVGSVYLCPQGSRDCYEHDPLRDACGGEDCLDGETCCYGFREEIPDGDTQGGREMVGECRSLTDDVYNCGGCDVVCEWDEVCLEGVCARGEGRSCWETECPEGMYCVSDVPIFRTNPKCKALLVDNENCGWYHHECAANKRCTNGLCLPKFGMLCDGECGEDEQCCWVLGVETCVDTQNDPLHCGSCNTICALGNLCQEGTCQPWYDVWDPCSAFEQVNCGGDDVECVDITSDVESCGGCGLPCPDGDVCMDGACATPYTVEGVPEEVPEQAPEEV